MFDAKIYHREYAKNWKTTHREHLRQYGRKYWRSEKRYKRRAKTIGDRHCIFCEIKLSSKNVKVKHTKYCDSCKATPFVKKFLRNFYMRRWYAKKNGLPIPEIKFIQEET